MDMLFAGWEVRMMKNCDGGLENTARDENIIRMVHSNETQGDLMRPFVNKFLQFLLCNLRYKCPN